MCFACVLCLFCKLFFHEIFVFNFLPDFCFIKFEIVLIVFFLGTILAINGFFSGSDIILACVLHCVFDVF